MSQVRILSSRWVSEIDKRASPKSAFTQQLNMKANLQRWRGFTMAVHSFYMEDLPHIKTVDGILRPNNGGSFDAGGWVRGMLWWGSNLGRKVGYSHGTNQQFSA
jgi:hypothetical protein